MDTKLWIVIVLLVALIGGFAGAMLFPQTVTETVTETVYVDVNHTIEVPVEVIKEVSWENTSKIDALQLSLTEKEAELEALKIRWEQLVNELYDEEDVNDELDAIVRAEDEVADDYMHEFLIEDYRISELEIVKFYDEDARIREVRRLVDGRWEDYDLIVVTFTCKVRYENDEGSEYERFDVRVEWDIDEDGDEEIDVEIDVE